MKKAQISVGTMIRLKDSGPMAPLYEVANNLDDSTITVLTPTGNVCDFLKAEVIVLEDEKLYQNSSKFFAQYIEDLYKEYMKPKDFEKIVKEMSGVFNDSYLKEVAEQKSTTTFGTAKCVMMGVFKSLSNQHQWIKSSERWGRLLRKALQTVCVL